MTEEKKIEPIPEKLKYVISPLERNIGVIFPEGTTESEKKLFAMNLETARQQKKDIEIDPSIKFVPLKTEEKTKIEENIGSVGTGIVHVGPLPVAPLGTQPQPPVQAQPIPPVQPVPQTPVQPTGQVPIQPPVQTPVQPVQPVQPQPTTEQHTEKVVTANPNNPQETVTTTEKVQTQG